MSFYDSDACARAERYWLDPPENGEHHPYCPMSQSKPWRPTLCMCASLELADRAALAQKMREDEEDK